MKKIIDFFFPSHYNLIIPFNDDLQGASHTDYPDCANLADQLKSLGLPKEIIENCISEFEKIINEFRKKSDKDFKLAKKALNNIIKELKKNKFNYKDSSLLLKYAKKLEKI